MTETTFLKLKKQETGENDGTWGSPLNDSLDLIDTWANSTDVEIKAARNSSVYGAKGSLDLRLEAGDAEILAARGNKASLDERISTVVDEDGTINAPEIVAAREGAADLKTNQARKLSDWADNAINDVPQSDFIVADVSAGPPVDIGVEVKANLTMDIQGYYCKNVIDTRVGNLNNSTFYYLYAQRPASGTVPVFGVETSRSYPDPPDRIYIGELLTTVEDLPSANIVSYREHARYDSWEVDGIWFTSPAVSGAAGEIEIEHNLGFIPSFCQIYVSEVADPTQGETKKEIELLDGVSSLRGGLRVKLTDTKMFIKYEGTAFLYVAYDGTEYTNGYLRVILGRMSMKGVLS